MTAKSVSFNPRMNSSPGSPLSATNNITYTTLRWPAAWEIKYLSGHITTPNRIGFLLVKKKEVE